MKGTNHIITGVSAAVAVDTILRFASDFFQLDFYDKLHDCDIFNNIIDTQSQMGSVMSSIFTIIICAALFLIGCLLPDIDQEHSTLGRIVHIPVKHRTWTHTIWVVMIITVEAIFIPWLAWLAYGCVLHIFFDSLSKGGICWFYPISQYKTWASGAQVKKNHKIYLYRTGETSEIIITMLVVIVGASMLVCNILLTVGVITLPFHAVC